MARSDTLRHLRLGAQQRFRLRQQSRRTRDAGVLRRTRALLQLDAGHPVAEVAAGPGVSRRRIHRWVGRYLEAPTPRGLRDRRGHGHVSAGDDDNLLAVLRCALGQPPSHWGYRDREWTVPLLQEHLQRWDGRRGSGTTVRRPVHQLGYAWKRPRYVLLPDPRRAYKVRRLREQIRGLGARAALLFGDETDLRLFPPPRAGWAKRGEPAEVPLSGRNARRVVFGAPHARTGHRLLLPRARQRGEDFRAFLELAHGHYRGGEVWLLVDEDPSHTAAASVGLARARGIGLLWLPKRCPERNAMGHLGGHAKDETCANHQGPLIDHRVDRFIRYIQGLSAEEARRKAGILSQDFWLKDVCDI